MYTHSREVTFKSIADMGKAMPTLQKLVATMQTPFGGRVRVMRPIGGMPSRLRVVVEYDSFDQASEQLTKLMGNPEYLALLQEFVRFIDPTRTVDDVWQSVG